MISNFYEWIKAKNFNEIKSPLAQEIGNWQKENQLPFDNMFPNGAIRVAIPLVTDKIGLGIIQTIENNGYEIDFNNGTAKKQNRAIKLGKLILNNSSLFNEDQKRWWIKQGNPISALETIYDGKDFDIIVSRSPYDIVRMSDHEELSSCHAPDGDYFRCAIAEAKGGGPIAYLINKADLNNIPNLQATEIFKDEDRRIDGVTPISRIRLRMFRNVKDDYDLAVPEVRVYGEKVPGFKDTLKNWALNQQQDVLQGERPNMRDFVRLGGSYADNLASKLFNDFFGDDVDSGDVPYEGEEEHNLYDQYLEEVEEIERKYSDKFTFATAGADVVEDGDEVYVYYYGSMYLELPVKTIRTPNDWKERRELRDKIKDICGKLDIWGVDDVEIEDNESGTFIQGSLHDDNGGSHPDDYRNFCQYLVEMAPKENELKAGIISVLTEMGYVNPRYISKLIGHGDEDNYNHTMPVFKHFDCQENPNYRGHSLLVSTKEEIPMADMSGYADKPYVGYHEKLSQFPGFIDVKSQLLKRIDDAANKMIATNFQKKQKQKLLWGEPEPEKKSFTGEFKIEPDIDFNWYYNNKVAMNIEFNLNVGQEDDDIKDALEFVKYLDTYFDFFAREAQMLFARLVLPHYMPKTQNTQPQPQPNQQQPQPTQTQHQTTQQPDMQANLQTTEGAITDFISWLKRRSYPVFAQNG